MDFVSTVENLVREHGFDHFGLAALEKPLSMDFYREWIEAGKHGSMNYLSDHMETKEHPQQLAPRATSAIVVTEPYFPHPYGKLPPEISGLRSALYAQGEDYHFHFAARLKKMAKDLESKFPGEEFLCFTDSGPILERDLAYRAGVGWIGKNTCVIHPQKGSLFFLGEILTSLNLPSAKARIHDFCGSCDRCIRSCPTQAIEEGKKLDATKCISYWTIEARGVAPLGLREKLGNWFFGCDICQTVCPWNEKHHGKGLLQSLTNVKNPSLLEDLRWILNTSNKGIAKALHSSPVIRARPRGLKRNALVIIGNLKLVELKEDVQKHLDDPHLGEIASWTLTQLT